VAHESSSQANDRRQVPGHAFYCACDRHHFVGLVALLNSLRLVAHDEPIYVVDAGLTEEQRRLLDDHVIVLPGPKDVSVVLLKPLTPLGHSADVSILLDTDIIVTRRLTELIELARRGSVVAFVDQPPNDDRFFSEWAPALGLRELRRQPYVNAGQLLVPDALQRTLLPAWNAGLGLVDVSRSWHGRGRLTDPFYFGDQDVLNAILAGTLEASQVTILDHRLAPHPPFPGLRLTSSDELLCSYRDGTRPFLLHHTLAKPWLKATRTNAYSLLLPRLLLAPDVALRLEPVDLPLRLRDGRLAAVDRSRANLQAFLVFHTRRQLGRFGIRTRFSDWRERRASGRA
jgi:hypothetical protein